MPTPNTTVSGPMTAIQSDVNPVVLAAYELFNKRDFTALPAIYAENVELINVASGERKRGVAGVESFLRFWIDAFSDAHVEIQSLQQAGSTAVCEFLGKGTHDGTFRTPMGDIPATGRTVEVAFCDVIRIDDNKITSITTYFDSGTFARQLGVS